MRRIYGVNRIDKMRIINYRVPLNSIDFIPFILELTPKQDYLYGILFDDISSYINGGRYTFKEVF